MNCSYDLTSSEECEILFYKKFVVRREHTCVECEQVIKKGDTCWGILLQCDDLTRYSYRICLVCGEISNYFCADVGNLWHEIQYALEEEEIDICLETLDALSPVALSWLVEYIDNAFNGEEIDEK